MNAMLTYLMKAEPEAQHLFFKVCLKFMDAELLKTSKCNSTCIQYPEGSENVDILGIRETAILASYCSLHFVKFHAEFIVH